MAESILAVDPRKCTGCKLCDLACSWAKTGTVDLERSCIKTTSSPTDQLVGPIVCLHCQDPECTRVCPTGAIAKNPKSGIVKVEEAKCIGCLLCTLACAYGGIYPDREKQKVYKCDLCGGNPQCLAPCEPEAIDFIDLTKEYTRIAASPDMLFPGLSFCPGCGLELSVRMALKEIGPNAILSVAPSCTAACGVAGYQDKTGAKVPVFYPLLTNSASMLTGVKRHFQRRGVDIHTVAIVGDGGTADVGFQSLSGAAERGENILYLCFNNEGYMNTGIQRSGTTPKGAWTTTTPVGRNMKGKKQQAKNIPLLMAMHGIPYTATLNFAYPDDFLSKIKRAKEIRDGLIYLEVFAPCPVGWKFKSEKTVEVARLAVQTNFFPLWEADHGVFRITKPMGNRRPVKEYLESMGKYSHLDTTNIEQVQAGVDDYVEFLKKLAKTF
jgi:phenylglyoxylate dehydrogenase beta subunit